MLLDYSTGIRGVRVHARETSDWCTRANASLSARRGLLRVAPRARQPSPPARQASVAVAHRPATARRTRAGARDLVPHGSPASVAGEPINPLGWGGALGCAESNRRGVLLISGTVTGGHTLPQSEPARGGRAGGSGGPLAPYTWSAWSNPDW